MFGYRSHFNYRMVIYFKTSEVRELITAFWFTLTNTDNINDSIFTNRLIVTGDKSGRIAFYDVTLRILYWCQLNIHGSICSIAFSGLTIREKIKGQASEVFQGKGIVIFFYI